MAAPVTASRFGISPPVTRLAAAVLGIALLAWGGFAASRAGSARRAELREARATLATFAEWRRRFEPAVAAESIAWRRRLMDLQELGIVGDERLSLARDVTWSAEGAGLRDVRVSVQGPDTTGSDARLSTEGILRRPAPFGLLVEARGNLQAVVTFVGELPPSVAPVNLTLVRQNGGARHRIVLAVYELDPSNGLSGSNALPVSTPVRTPLERGDVDRGRLNRLGG